MELFSVLKKIKQKVPIKPIIRPVILFLYPNCEPLNCLGVKNIY